MSVIPKESIEVVAQTIGIDNISHDVSPALALDVEYRIREIMQEAIKCMRHSMRTSLTCEDVDSALNLRNVEPVHSFGACEGLQFKRAGGYRGLYYLDDRDVDFRNVVESPLPKALFDAAVGVHWLAVEGVQPDIPENASAEGTLDRKISEYKDDSHTADLKSPGKHILSKELQLYLEKITEISTKRTNSFLFTHLLATLKTDARIYLLLPYLIQYISNEVAKNSNDISILIHLMRVVQSLFRNQYVHVEPYIHQLIPSIMTCLLAKRLNNTSSSDRELIKLSANLIADIWKRFGLVYYNLQPRITRTLLHVFLDPNRSFSQHYGAIQGLVTLGPQAVRLILLPNLEMYLQILEPELTVEKQRNAMKRSEAQHVYGALMLAAGLSIFDLLKTKSPSLFYPSNQAVWTRNTSVMTMSNKRKLSSDNLEQRPTKKQQLEGGGAVPSDIQGLGGGLSNSTVGSNMSSSQMARQMSFENRGEMNGSASSSSSVLTQAWKEDVATGRLLVALVPHFGESILYFTPNSELSLFL